MIPVSTRAAVQRINRRLAHDWGRICVTRARWHYDLGAYHVVDRQNVVTHKLDNIIDLEAYARSVGCLGADEEILP